MAPQSKSTQARKKGVIEITMICIISVIARASLEKTVLLRKLKRILLNAETFINCINFKIIAIVYQKLKACSNTYIYMTIDIT